MYCMFSYCKSGSISKKRMQWKAHGPKPKTCFETETGREEEGQLNILNIEFQIDCRWISQGPTLHCVIVYHIYVCCWIRGVLNSSDRSSLLKVRYWRYNWQLNDVKFGFELHYWKFMSTILKLMWTVFKLPILYPVPSRRRQLKEALS